jgi:LytS/YehU family sensor histidine kinase
LVENAVQHGSQLESNQNPVNLDISRDENELKLVITNKVAKDDTHKGFGIGLSNTRERLSKIYTHFRLELHPLENGLFETLLAIPIEEQDA